jgi:O-antigen/teichoic acid export membrane protein
MRHLLHRRFVRSGIAAFLANAGGLAINVVTGIIVARALSPDGRGELTALLTIAQVFGWLAALSASRSIAYRLSIEPDAGARLRTTWLAVLPALALLGILAAQLALPVLLSAQRPETVDIARLYVLTIALTVLGEIVQGLVAGHQAFVRWSVMKLYPPLFTVVAYAILWPLDALTLESALLVNAASLAALPIAGLLWLARVDGPGRVDLQIARRTLTYGVKGQLATMSAAVNLRLDLLVLPAVLVAGEVGQYAVATSVAAIVITLAGTLWGIAMPAAARRGAEGHRTIVASLHVTFVLGCALAAGVLALAPLLVPLLYGEAFEPAVGPLQLLLPGAILLPCANVLVSGLYAVDRPHYGAFAHLAGAVVTGVGLAAFLESGGIAAAAIVSSVAYGLVFVVAIVLYRRATRLRWGDLAPSHAGMRAMLRPPVSSPRRSDGTARPGPGE